MANIYLSVTDRILLQQLLPDRGGMIEMTTVKGLLDKIKFTSAEIEEFELVDTPGNVVKFNPQTNRDKPVALDPASLAILKAIPPKMDADKRVTVAMIPLLQKLTALQAE